MGTFNICIIFKGSKTKLLLTCICLTFLVTFVFISDTILFMKAQTLMGQVNEVVGFKKTKNNPKRLCTSMFCSGSSRLVKSSCLVTFVKGGVLGSCRPDGM